MQDGPPPLKRQPVSPEEDVAVFSVPAFAANKFYIHISGLGVRLTFAEQSGGIPAVRAAAMMPIQDAITLKDVLSEMLAPLESQIADAEAAKSKGK